MNTNQVARIAGLVGEPARTAMLLALMDGRALTARELADAARVTPPTASRHLAQLVDAGLLTLEHQGRHRYHRLASTEVAQLLEGLMQLAVRGDGPRITTGPRDPALRLARCCYDHIAGRLGVAITERLLEAEAIAFDGEAGQVTDAGQRMLARWGLTSALSAAGTRPLCRPCLDWSERRPHLAGRLGALICAHCLKQGWLLRRPGSRALAVTPRGELGLRGWLGSEDWREQPQRRSNTAAMPCPPPMHIVTSA